MFIREQDTLLSAARNNSLKEAFLLGAVTKQNWKSVSD